MSQVSPVDLISLPMMTEALQSLRSPESARHLSLCFSLQEAAHSVHSQLKSSCCPSDSDSDVIFEFGQIQTLRWTDPILVSHCPVPFFLCSGNPLLMNVNEVYRHQPHTASPA